MGGLQDYGKIDQFVAEMKELAGDDSVWAFVATYDQNGEFNWKAYAVNEALDADIGLGSQTNLFDAVEDIIPVEHRETVKR